MSDDFDPRFDPAFQRGYEAAPSKPRRTAAAPARAAAPSIEPTAAAAVEAQPRTPVDEFAEQPRTQVEQFLEPPARRANPFIIALIVLSLALGASGLYLVVKLRDLYAATQGSGAIDYVTIQVLIGVAPIALGLGFATALGVLFVYAVRWGRSEER